MKKSTLLEYFRQHAKEYISGEQLAMVFGVTRAGIWKHIKSLEADGYLFDAQTNKGYRLVSNILSENEILQNIDLPLLLEFSPSGKVTCETFEEIDSTNTYAKSHPTENLHIICANHQTAGRGRRGNQFFSPKNSGIYFSVVFHPSELDTTLFTVVSAIAVCKVLSELSGKPAGIKWVNDIYLSGKKICGILTEGTFDFESGTLDQVIVGIGINLSTSKFPSEIAKKAGALGIDCDRNALVGKITNAFFHTLKQNREDIIAEYSNLSIVLSKHISFSINGEEKYATATSFNRDGNLICHDQDGQEIILKAGEISILGDFA